MASSQSTYTLQNLFDDLVAKGDLNPGWDQSGDTVRPLINIANATMVAICGGEGMFPWKWNQFNLPLFLWNSWQQDYALVGQQGAGPTNGGPSLTNLAWLQEGIAIDINNPSMPKPWSWVKVGRNQNRSSGAYISNSAYKQPLCACNFLPNNELYYGTWGAAQTGTQSWGNNPQAGQVITNPLGNGSSMPNNPICQIQDANGNFLVLTGYGTLGSTAPVAPAASAAGVQATPGTGDTTVWTVVDPYGQGIRVSPVPSQTGTVWQINLVGQLKPTKFTASSSLASQTLFPLTDDYYEIFLKGASAEAYSYNPNPKVRASHESAKQAWLQSIVAMRRQVDREPDMNRIKPSRSIIGSGGAGSGGNLGPFWPFNYPVT